MYVYAKWAWDALRSGVLIQYQTNRKRPGLETRAGFSLVKIVGKKGHKGNRRMDLLKLIELMCGMLCMADLLETGDRAM